MKDIWEDCQAELMASAVQIGRVTPLLSNVDVRRDITWSYQLMTAVQAVPVAVIRWILHGCSVLHSSNHHLWPPVGFCINFAYLKLTMQIANGSSCDCGMLWCLNCEVVIMSLYGCCNGHNYKDCPQIPSFSAIVNLNTHWMGKSWMRTICGIRRTFNKATVCSMCLFLLCWVCVCVCMMEE